MANQTYILYYIHIHMILCISFMDLFIKVYFYDCLSMRFLWRPYNRKPADPFDPGQIKHDNSCRGLTQQRWQWKNTLLHGRYTPQPPTQPLHTLFKQRLLSNYWKYLSTRYYCRWRQYGLAST